ncbi:hypothetical protein JCM10213_006037 [Rhodosporidiobolus nylandii]
MSSSASTLPDIPKLPSLDIEPSALYSLIPFSLLHSTLLPFCPFPAGSVSEHVPRAPACAIPSWNSELEAWHRMIHPEVWRVLHRDEHKDCLANAALEALEADHAADAARTAHGRDWLDELKARRYELGMRILRRWTRLLALDSVREVYLARKAPGLDDAAIIAALPPMPLRKELPIPPSKPYRFWPIYTLPPALPHTGQPPTDLVFLHSVSHGLFPFFGRKMQGVANWKPFELPDYPSPVADETLRRIKLGLAPLRDSFETVVTDASADDEQDCKVARAGDRGTIDDLARRRMCRKYPSSVED